MGPIRWLRNWNGRSQGYGACMHCGDTWNWKRYFPIRYSAGGGMFPLCADCFQNLRAGQIIDYIDKLVEEWKQWPDPNRDYDAIRKGAKEEVVWLKFGTRANLDPSYTTEF